MKKNLFAMSVIGLMFSPVAQSSSIYVQGEGTIFSQLSLNLPSLESKSINAIPFRLSLGSYLYSANDWAFGIEGGYLHWDRDKSYPWNFKQNGWDLLAVADYKIVEGLHGIGKLGFAYIDQKIDFSQSYSFKNLRARPELVGGLAYYFNDHVALTGMVNHIFGKKVTANNLTDTASTTNLMAGLRLQF